MKDLTRHIETLKKEKKRILKVKTVIYNILVKINSRFKIVQEWICELQIEQ